MCGGHNFDLVTHVQCWVSELSSAENCNEAVDRRAHHEKVTHICVSSEPTRSSFRTGTSSERDRENGCGSVGLDGRSLTDAMRAPKADTRHGVEGDRSAVALRASALRKLKEQRPERADLAERARKSQYSMISKMYRFFSFPLVAAMSVRIAEA